MPSYPEDFLEVNWAREATKGLDLPTTSKAIVETFNPTPSTPPAHRPRTARGLLAANRGNSSVIQRGTNIAMEGPVTFEQAQHLFNGTIKNVATPTGASPYIWTHTRNPAAAADIASFTFERRVTDKVTPYDDAFHYAMFSDLTLSFASNDVWKYQANLFARAQQAEAITASITLPTFEECKVPGTKVFINDTWAALATPTQVVGQMLSGSVRFGSGAAPRWLMDGRTDFDWTEEAYASSRVTCEVNLLMRMGLQYPIEQAKAKTAALRAMRIQVDGTAGKQIQLDMLLEHEVPDLYGLQVDDEEFVVPLKLVGSTDGTNLWQAKVTNLVATFA